MAGKIALDLKQFKHVKSDKDSTTLKHAQGHELTIHHKSLSPESQAQLDALSKISQDSKTSTQDAEEVSEKKPVKMAEGGSVEKAHPFSEMSKEEILQALAMDPDAFKRAQEMAAGTMGSVSMVGPATMEATTAAEGINGLAALKSAKPQFGETINVVPQPGMPAPMPNLGTTTVIPQAPQALGKVIMKAEGGPIQAPVEDPTQDLFTTDPNAAMPAIQQAFQTGQETKLSEAKGRAAMLRSALEHDRPFVDPSTPQEQELDGLNLMNAEQERKQQEQVINAQKQQDTSASIAAQRAKLGLPPDMSTPMQQGQMQADAAMQPPTSQPQSLAGKVEAATTGGGMPQDPAGIFQQGYQNRMAGINQEAAATGALGQQQANILGQQVQAQQQAQQAYKDQFAGLEAERQAHMADIKAGHIDPEKYWNNHSKLAAGIGMILAGFNPTTSPNAGISFLKNQMDLNIQAQSKNLDSDQNLLAANLRQFGNLKDAADFTRIMQHDIVANQLNQAASTAKSPMSQAAAKQAAGQLQMEAANQFQNFAMRRAMMGMANSPNSQSPQAIEQMLGYMRVTNPEMAKEMESRYVPGVGMATIPIPQEARSQMLMRKNFDSMAQKYLQYAQQHGGSFDPATVAQGKALAAELQGAFRQASNGGVFKEGEQKFIEKLIPDDPTQMLSQFRTNPKIKEILSTNQASMNNLARGYGLPVHQAPVVDQQAQAMAWAKANPKDPRAAQILQKLGK